MRCGHSLVSAHSPRSVCTLPGLCIHSPGSACGLSSLQDEVCTLPNQCAHCLDGQVAGWRGDWSFAAGNSPKCSQGSFLCVEGESSCSILCLLLYKEGPVLSHSPPLQLNHRLSRSGSHTTRLSTLPRQHPGLVCLSLCPYSPPYNFKQPGLSWCCSSLVWQGRELLTWLSL